MMLLLGIQAETLRAAVEAGWSAPGCHLCLP